LPGLFEPGREVELYHSSPGQQPAQARLRPFASSRRTRKQPTRRLGRGTSAFLWGSAATILRRTL